MAMSLEDRTYFRTSIYINLSNRYRLGAFGISFGLPLVTYLMTFLCNDISGCPVPSLLHPYSLTIDKLKEDAGWPVDGILGLASFEVTGVVLAYYLFSMILYRVLPGEEAEGAPLRSGGKLKYKFNSAFFKGSLMKDPYLQLYSFLIFGIYGRSLHCRHSSPRCRLPRLDFHLG